MKILTILLIIHLSHDGVPETKDLGMSIGTHTIWNFGDHVRSRDFYSCPKTELLSIIMTTTTITKTSIMYAFEGITSQLSKNSETKC